MFAKELQVKQYVAVVKSRWSKFMVFETGDSRYYLFCTIKDGIQTGIQFPVLKADLKPEIRKALAHGWGNASI